MTEQTLRAPARIEATYEAPAIRTVGNAREVFLGGDGDGDDNFKAPNRSRSCN